MKKYLSILIGLIGVILTGLTVYYQIFHKDTITLDIERVNSTLLTKPPHTKGLKASYTYRDSIIVKKLWETTFVIRNTGKTTILGEGFSGKNIKDDCLPFQISNCEKLLSASITNCNNSAHIGDRKLCFTQWKQDEYVEITLITEGKKAPNLRISDRDIIDSKITYSEYSPKLDISKRKLIDSVPSTLSKILKWLYVAIMVIVFLSIIFFGIPEELKKTSAKSEKVVFVISIIIAFLFLALPLLWMF